MIRNGSNKNGNGSNHNGSNGVKRVKPNKAPADVRESKQISPEELIRNRFNSKYAEFMAKGFFDPVEEKQFLRMSENLRLIADGKLLNLKSIDSIFKDAFKRYFTYFEITHPIHMRSYDPSIHEKLELYHGLMKTIFTKINDAKQIKNPNILETIVKRELIRFAEEIMTLFLTINPRARPKARF